MAELQPKDNMDQILNKFSDDGAKAWEGVNPRELRGDLTWKPEKPTVPGWYWFVLSDTAVALRVRHKGGGGLCAFLPVRGWMSLEEIEDSLWCGPIQAPPIPEIKRPEFTEEELKW